MKKQQNKTLRIASVLLVLALVTTVALTGTLARYTAEAIAKSQTVRVAAWDVEINFVDPDDATKWKPLKSVTPAEFALLGTYGASVYTHGLMQSQEDNKGNAWEEVENSQLIKPAYNKDVTGTIDFLVHPGIGGYLNFWVRNNSEVPAAVTIDLGTATVDAKLNVIKLEIGNTEMDATGMAGTFSSDLTQFTTAAGAAGSSVIVNPSATPTATLVSIAWKWDFGETEASGLTSADCGTIETDPCDGVATGEFCSVHNPDGALKFKAAIDTADTLLGDEAANLAVTEAVAAILENAKITVTQVD